MTDHYLHSPQRQEEHDVLFGTINRFIGYFSRDAQKNTTNDPAIEYPFVAMDTRQAYEQIRFAKQYLSDKSLFRPDLRFIDIGCGIGNILLIAELLDFSVHGIEKDQASHRIAAKLLDESQIEEADIWQYDQFGEFDVIYYFRPFPVSDLQTRFELMIEDQIKRGGILIANRKMDQSVDSDPRFSRLTPDWPIWVKK